MKKIRKISIVGITILFVAFILMLLFYNQDKTELNNRELSYTQNYNKNLDIEVINSMPVFSGNKGIINEYLKTLKSQTQLSINEITYNRDETASTAGIKFKIKDINDKPNKNEVEFFKDYYVALSKKNIKINGISDFSNFKIAVNEKSLNDISYYLRSANNITYKTYQNSETLFDALNKEDVQLAIVPNIMYLDYIIKENYRVVFGFEEISNSVVLDINIQDRQLKDIINKVAKGYLQKEFYKQFNHNFVNLYLDIKNISSKEKADLKSKEYNYGYIDNAPYEVKSGKSIQGINSELLSKISKILNIDIKYNHYNNYSSLLEGIKSEKIDILYNNHDIKAANYRSLNIYNKDKYVIVSRDTSRRNLNSLESLKDQEVIVLKNSTLYSILSNENSIKLKLINNFKEVSKYKDKYVALDKEEYEYYKNSIFKNYFVELEIPFTKSKNFMVKNNHDLLYQLMDYILNNSSYNLDKNIGFRALQLEVFKNKTYGEIYLIVVLILCLPIIIFYSLIWFKKWIKQRRMNIKEDRQKYTDLLTSLKNRNYLNHKMPIWNESGMYPQAVILIDLNNIKYINDKYGHLEGDKEIKKAATILVNNQIEKSEIIRSDGNEFIVYLVEYSPRQIELYTKKLKKEFKKLPHGYGASIGYSVIEDEIKTLDDAINEANLMMRREKNESNDIK